MIPSNYMHKKNNTYNYIYFKNLFHPKPPAGAAGSTQCILSSPLCRKHPGSPRAAEPPWLKGCGKAAPASWTLFLWHIPAPSRHQLSSALQEALWPSQVGPGAHLWWPCACLVVGHSSCSFNRKQTSLGENYARIFFIQARMELWRIYGNSTEPRVYSVFFITHLVVPKDVGGCRTPRQGWNHGMVGWKGP